MDRWTTSRRGEYDTQSLDRRLVRGGSGRLGGGGGHLGEGSRRLGGNHPGSGHMVGSHLGDHLSDHLTKHLGEDLKLYSTQDTIGYNVIYPKASTQVGKGTTLTVVTIRTQQPFRWFSNLMAVQSWKIFSRFSRLGWNGLKWFLYRGAGRVWARWAAWVIVPRNTETLPCEKYTARLSRKSSENCPEKYRDIALWEIQSQWWRKKDVWTSRKLPHHIFSRGKKGRRCPRQ